MDDLPLLSGLSVSGVIFLYGPERAPWTQKNLMAPLSQGLKKRKKSGKPSIDITDRVVATALENPELGAGRLAQLLRDEGLGVSRGQVYRMLRGRGLQTRELRRRFLEEQAELGEAAADEAAQREANIKPSEPLSEQIRRGSAPPVSTPGIEYAASPVSAAGGNAPEAPAGFFSGYSAASASVPPIKKLRKSKIAVQKKEKWLFRSINLLLSIFIILLVIHIGVIFYNARQKPIEEATVPAPTKAAAEAGETVAPSRPLNDYHVIVKRNLFGSANPPESDPARESAALEAIDLAGKEIGLRLIGTAVGKDRRKNYAVLEVAKTHSQQILREKDTVANVLIKRIWRNNVIIMTASGEKRLSVDEKFAASAEPSPVQPATASTNYSGVPQVNTETGEMTQEISRSEISQSLSDIQKMLEESNSSETVTEGKPDGFTLGRLRARDAFFRIGLRTGDVIKSVDGEAVNSPEDAELLIERLTEGGNFSILVERAGKLQSLSLSVK